MMRLLIGILFSISVCRADTFTADNAALVSGRVGSWNSVSTSAKTITVGDQQCLNFTGTSLSCALTTGADNYVSISVSVDSGAPTTYDLDPSTTSVTLATGLSNSSHTAVITYAKAFSSAAGSRWNGDWALTINSVTVDSGKTISAYTLPANGSVIFFGDSITEGAGLFASLSIQNWTRLIANNYVAKLVQVGFSGQGYEVGPPYEPVFISTYNYFYNGVSRVYPTDLKCVTLNGGTNGTTTAADVKALLEAVRSSVGASVFIKQLIPFGGYNRSSITTGYGDYVSAHPSDSKVALIDLGSASEAVMANPAYAPDGVHPNPAGCAVLAGMLVPYYGDCLASMSATTLNVTTLHVGP